MQDLGARIRAATARIESRDRRLAEELNDVRRSAGRTQEARTLAARFESKVPGLEGVTAARPDFALETIVLRVGRPVLAVIRDEPRLEFRDAESDVWRQRLVSARDHLVRAIRATGRIEVKNHFTHTWVGTGWLVAEDVIATNRHVASLFAHRQGTGFVFSLGRGGRRIGASIDFLEEIDRTESLDFRLQRILHIEDADGPDIALLQVEPVRGRNLAEPIALASRAAARGQRVAVIGYPAKDSHFPDQQLMEDIFGDVYDKKRLAPGEITASSAGEVEHDCTTLGGNSGSMVLDLNSGQAVALHFAGIALESNFAVPAQLVADRLRAVGRNGRRPSAPAVRPGGRGGETGDRQAPSNADSTTLSLNVSSGSASYTIPLRITLDVGVPTLSGGLGTAPGEEDDEIMITEAVPEDYSDRSGYLSGFLGSSFEVPLPSVSQELEGDVLTFDLDGNEERELRYQRFSVVMNRSRRLCFFSAVNIDGMQPKKAKRPKWRLDPRIPAEAQIIRECYGAEPKFSRGHMTRREDPMWGTQEEAKLGNQDSMHVTNAVPQMQPFNGGIWLDLEDYALDNAREDDMRISVFTGPFLREDDPVRFGVQIPLSFWKVIAFIHDETGKLSATGYTMSQEDFLRRQESARREEFVFGQHETAQVPISLIERETGLSFGDLASRDPLRTGSESLAGPLRNLRQIRF